MGFFTEHSFFIFKRANDMLSEINDIEPEIRVHVNFRRSIVNWSSVCRRTVCVKPSLVTIPYHRHSSRSCQPEYSMFPIPKKKKNPFHGISSFRNRKNLWSFILFINYLEESWGAITIATASGNIIWQALYKQAEMNTLSISFLFGTIISSTWYE